VQVESAAHEHAVFCGTVNVRIVGEAKLCQHPARPNHGMVIFVVVGSLKLRAGAWGLGGAAIGWHGEYNGWF